MPDKTRAHRHAPLLRSVSDLVATLTTAHLFGLNRNSNNRYSENRACSVLRRYPLKYLGTMCNGPTNALVCNKTLIQMSHIKTLKITPTCFDHQLINIRELFDPS
jgi:hypothetical protein